MRRVIATTLALAGLSALAIMGCTDAGDPVFPSDPGGGGGALTVDLAVSDGVGAWDNMHVNGPLTGDTPVAMTQDGLMWTASVEVDSADTYDYGLYYDDGLKALQPIRTGLSVTVSESGEVTGDTTPELEGNADDGFRLVVTNNNTAQYDNIKIKGTYDGWATTERDGQTDDGGTVWRNIAGGLAAGDYEWGVIHDDGTEFGVWLPDENLQFSVDAEGVVTGQTTFEIPPGTPEIDVTFAVDMSGETMSLDGVNLAGSFGADGYVEWQASGIPLSDADEDDVWEVTLTLRQEIAYQFKFINGSSWPDSEVVPPTEGCTVDDGVSGAHNRLWTTPASETATYSSVFGAACPASR